MAEFNDNDNNNYDPLKEMNNMINSSKIHIKIQRRNARKSICTIEGLQLTEDELKDLTKDMKKKFACNGTIIKDETLGNIIKLQGDIREKAKKILISKHGISEDNIVVHGYD
jgi:translation initiation factor 1